MQASQWTKHSPAIISPRTPPQGRAWGRGGGHRAGAGAGQGQGAGTGTGAGAHRRGPPGGGSGKPRHLPLAKNPFSRTGYTVHVWAGRKHAIP